MCVVLKDKRNVHPKPTSDLKPPLCTIVIFHFGGFECIMKKMVTFNYSMRVLFSSCLMFSKFCRINSHNKT